MKSLDARHAERAQRKADNAVESEVNGTTGNIGHAVTAALAAHDAMKALTPEQMPEFQEIMEQHTADLKESGHETFEMAGIGVANPLTTSGRQFLETADSKAQTGKLPEPSFDPANGNIAGQAIEAASKGWGDNADADKGESKADAKTDAKAEAEKK